MKLISARDLWSHDDERVREFGKAFFVVLAIFGALAARAALAKIAVPLDAASRLAIAWHAAKLWWLLAWAVLTFATAFPWFTRPVYVVMNLAGMCIGFVFGHVVLAIMFFAMFVTIGQLRRATSPVQKGFDKQEKSYWKTHVAPKHERYYRQY